jgi:hypothetical protein
MILKEELTGDSVWIMLHHYGAVGQMRQQERRNIRVILKQFPFGDAFTRPKHLFQVGKTDSSTAGPQRRGGLTGGNLYGVWENSLLFS